MARHEHRRTDVQTIRTRDGVTIALCEHWMGAPTRMTYRMGSTGALKMAFRAARGSDGAWAAVGDPLFLPPGSEKSFAIHAGEYTTLSCFFPEAVLCDAGWDSERTRVAARIGSLAAQADLRRLFAMLRDSCPGSNSLVEAASKVALFEALQDIGREPVAAASRSGGLPPWRHERIRRRIADGSLPVPSVAELARCCGITARHLARAYRVDTGRTISSLITCAMTARATRLLSDGCLPIKRIAADLGFSSTASFSVAFMRETGMRPAAYRASIGLPS